MKRGKKTVQKFVYTQSPNAKTSRVKHYTVFSRPFSFSLAADQNKDIVAPHHKHIRYIWRNQYAVFLICVFWLDAFLSVNAVVVAVVMFPLTFRFMYAAEYVQFVIPVSANRPDSNRQSNYAPTCYLFRNPYNADILYVAHRSADKKRLVWRARTTQ